MEPKECNQKSEEPVESNQESEEPVAYDQESKELVGWNQESKEPMDSNQDFGDEPVEYRIYEVGMVLGMIKDVESVRAAQDWACDLVRERARVLEMDEWLEEPWGRLEQRVRRAQRPRRRRVVKKMKNGDVPFPDF